MTRLGNHEGLRGNIRIRTPQAIGSIRRECLDHMIILNERHLKRILSSYVAYYDGARTHLSLAKDTPDGREVQAIENSSVVELKRVGGLHHLYTRVSRIKRRDE